MGTSTYNETTAEELCALVAEGETLEDACKKIGQCSYRTAARWERAFPVFKEQLELAREQSAEALIDKANKALQKECANQVEATQQRNVSDGS
jgi:Bacteriophage Sf6, terminase small subunit-like